MTCWLRSGAGWLIRLSADDSETLMTPFSLLLTAALLAGAPPQSPGAAAGPAHPSPAIVAVPPVVPPLAAASPLHVSGVENAFQVSASLFRGAQPSEPGLAELKKLGISVIVNLRERGSEVESERKLVEALGLRYVSIPVGSWSAPAREQVVEFLTLLRRSPGDKIFVHCHLGRDRTGVMIAAYRVAEQHWSAGQAIAEMHTAGFHALLQPQMWAFVKRFPEAFATEAVFLPFRQAKSLAALNTE